MPSYDKSAVSPLTQGNTVTLLEAPPELTTESLLLSLLVQQSDNYDLLRQIDDNLHEIEVRLSSIEGHLENIDHDLTSTTLSDSDGVRGVDRHAVSTFVSPNDPRDPQTLKDFIALIKTEVRHSDDCAYERMCREKPWALLLVIEQFGMDDLDGNGLIFGHTFIFSDPHEEWPPVLQDAIDRDEYDAWFGTKISFTDYRNGLPDGSAFRAHVSDWIGLVG